MVWQKWVAGLAGIALLSWMGFISATMISMNNSLSVLKAEVLWIKNEATQGGRNTESDGRNRDRRLDDCEKKTEQYHERVIKLEVLYQKLHAKYMKE